MPLLHIRDLREAGSGIFYTKAASDSFFLADCTVIGFLKGQAAASPTRRARICAHPDVHADQHDMLIASHHETYVAPHMHPAKSESFLILEGFADVFLFDDNGQLKERIPMGPAGSNRPFFYRMPALQFHALAVASDVLVFVESTKGPFDSSQTVNATWAPAPDRIQEGREFLRKVSEIEPVTSMDVGACQTSSLSSR